MKKVCITGASGYLASHIIIKLLNENYYVKALTRNKEHFLLNYHKCLIPFTNNICNLDILEYNHESTDEKQLINILNDCDVLVHCASPVILEEFKDEVENVNKIINPAIKYTETILSASLLTNITKIIFISSTSAIYDGTKSIYTNDYIADLTKIKDAYSISKIKSEQIAWKIYNENKKWELIVLNPGRIIGPVIYNKIPESYCSILEAIKLSKMYNNQLVTNYYSSFCDVRDVANISVYSINNLTTKRYIITFEIKEFKHYCDMITHTKINFITDNNIFDFENSFKSYKYISFKQSILDSIKSIHLF
jgi:nucleoside-diphosphate-sugar epimerase